MTLWRWRLCDGAKILAEITARWCGGAKIEKVAHVAVVRNKEKWHAPSTGTVPKLFFLVVIKIIIKRFLYMLTKLAEKEDEFSTFSGQEMYHKNPLLWLHTGAFEHIHHV